MKKEPRKTVGEGSRTTLSTLAKHVGLSRTTVSVVVSNSPAATAIPQKTRDRILQAAQDLQYRPNYLARSLRQNRTMSIGVIVPELSEGYFTLLMRGVEQHLMGAHYMYFTASHYWQPELLTKYPRLLLERAVDGLLLLNTPVPEDIPLPIVSVSSHKAVKGVTNLVLNHKRAVVLALRHLKQLKHKRIAFMRGQNFSLDTDERWTAILQVSKELGIKVDPELCIQLENNTWSPELGYEPVRALLKQRSDFTAIFCFNDTSAFGAMRAIHDFGYRVPEDISVVGFDDVIGAEFAMPSLTTVRQPLSEMGNLAAKLLLRRIDFPRAAYKAKIVVEPELIIRESTSKAKSRTK